jgi:membrane-associated phospholipid phosphatase
MGPAHPIVPLSCPAVLARPRIRFAHSIRARGHPLARGDLALLRLLRSRGHQRPVEVAMRATGWMGEWGAIWTGSSLVAAATDRRRRGRWLAAAAVPTLAIPVNYAFKRAIRRERPVIEELPALGYAASSLSFPSAHATSSVAAAIAMGRVAPAARPVLYGLAALICVGRPYLGMHYPSDVLVGAALGVAIGRAIPGLDGADDVWRPPSSRPPPPPPPKQ